MLAPVLVQNHGSGAFTQVADILNSGSLLDKAAGGGPAQKITMAGLWETLPDTFTHNLAQRAEFPVLGFRETSGGIFPRPTVVAVGEVEGIPSRVHDAASQLDALKEFLDHYPTTNGWLFAANVPPATQWSVADATGVHVVKLAWPNPTTQPVPSLEMRVATRYLADFYLLPALGDNPKPLHPLLAWWAILYVLSMLARYEPSACVKMTDINCSVEASPIEHLLEVALARLPRLIVDTIDEVSV